MVFTGNASPALAEEILAAGKADLEALFEWPLTRANQIRSQQQRQRAGPVRGVESPQALEHGGGGETERRDPEGEARRRLSPAAPRLRGSGSSPKRTSPT